MKVLIDDDTAEAAERVRKRDGDRSITATVARLVKEADGKHAGAGVDGFADVGATRRTKRKGARS